MAFGKSHKIKLDRPKLHTPRSGKPSYGSDWFSTVNRIQTRDGHCCMHPGCKTTTGLHTHHINTLSRGGAVTSGANLITLCERHHELRHAHMQRGNHFQGYKKR